MNNEELQVIYLTYKKKIKVYSWISAVLLIILLCLPISILIKIPLAVLVFLAALIISGTSAKKKYLDPVLSERLDPQSYLSLIYATNNINKYALDEIICAFLLYDYEKAASICLLKLADPKCKAYKLYYMAYLARIYFDTGEYDKLNEIREKFRTETAAKRNGQAIRNNFKLFTFYDLYFEGKYEECRRLYELLYKDPKFCQTRLNRLMVAYSLALVTLKAGDTDKAKALFSRIAGEAPHLNLGIIASDYLSALENGTEYSPVPKNTEPDSDFKLPLPPKNPNTKRSVVVLVICIAVIAALAAWGAFTSSPKEPFRAIAMHESISELCGTIAIEGTDDMLAVYSSQNGALYAAYLKGNGDGKYTYKLSSEELESGYKYTICSAGSDLKLTFELFDDTFSLPDEYCVAIELDDSGKTRCFCLTSVEERDTLFDSTGQTAYGLEDFFE
ncbi:MAG: tetratricopeptide repeat protein [Acutalibacteraceae bacterium]